MEVSYFSDICIDRDNLEQEFPQILRRIKELRMEFIFAEMEECNLHMGLHYTYITRERVCLVYALMTAKELNIGAVLKSTMRKPKFIKGTGVPKENVDSMALLFPASVDITRTKGPDTEFGPTLSTPRRHRHDELIMARMYDLEMLRLQNGY
ncbi:hypothetical protein H5410_040917 [Solanum commersonii]|uniref:Uncharacterized protein n=1 Tax=Solanum commersonii TaxID=4109 RepID=A0A9J5XQ53_SOLCO|nr:hypothetical protein H5410_040917 [Solanum commersonii]